MPIYYPPTSGSGVEGGVTGPGTSTTNHVALFADSSGVTLKDGGALGDAATLNLGTTVGTIAEGLHAHEIADITGLETAIASIPSPAPSSYEISNINGLTVALAGKADTFHNHEIAEVTGLQTALDGKASSTHTHDLSTSDVTGVLPLANGGTGQTSLSNSVQSFLDDISSTQGTILYKGASSWSALATGTSGQFLQTHGAATNPTWANDKLELIIAVSDETTALTTGTAKVTFRMPYAMTLTDVRASVATAPTASALIIDIKESGTTIFSTKLSIDASEKTSMTAVAPNVLSDTALADDAEITINIDQIGSTIAGAGAKVTLIGTRA